MSLFLNNNYKDKTMGSFSVFHFIIMTILAFLLYVALRSFLPNTGKITANGQMICQNCGTRGEPKTVVKGSLAIEIILWLCFIIPGLIYSVWRMTSTQPVCPSCKQPTMIGVGTPIGKNLANQFGKQEPENGCKTKTCHYCNAKISETALICPKCGGAA